MLDGISEETPASQRVIAEGVHFRGHRYWWLNLILLALTFCSTTIFGFALEQSFQSGRSLDESAWLLGWQLLTRRDPRLWSGTIYSAPLLLILLAHEFGHYGLCRRWKIAATLPFFGPSPTLLGTIGAFIWIRSPIYRRRALFDVGVSGPLLGFLVLLPFLVVGIWNSKVCPGMDHVNEFSFGTPLLMRVLERVRFPGVPPHWICLHPTAMAAWAGLLATAINLLPVGQLDGGHIIYAVFGEKGHRIISLVVIGVLALGGVLYWPWVIWAIALFFVRRHPLIHDAEKLGPWRRTLAAAAVLLLILSLSVVPVRTS